VGSRRLFLKMAGALLGAVVMPAESRGQGALERRIPRTGEALPAVGLGTWQVFDVAGDSKELAQAKETLRVFVDGGGHNTIRLSFSAPSLDRIGEGVKRLSAALDALTD